MDEESVESTGATGASFEDVWEAWEVRAAVDRLPDNEREVVRLHYARGYSQSQMAELLGVPLGTVKSRTSRAHHRLQESLAHLSSDSTDEPPSETSSGAR